MNAFNLERAKTYEENKIPSLKLYYSLVNKNFFFSALFFELIYILFINGLYSAQISKAFVGCLLLYAVTCLLGIFVTAKAPYIPRPGVEINLKTVKWLNLVSVPFSVAMCTALSIVPVICIAFFITGKFPEDYPGLIINTILIFESIWLLFYIFHIYSDKELGLYLSEKKRLLTEGKSLKDILQTKEDYVVLNLKIQPYNKLVFGCKILNSDSSTFVIQQRIKPTTYILIYFVTAFSLFTIGATCIFAGIAVYFHEARIEPIAFIIGFVCIGLFFGLKSALVKNKQIVFDRSKRVLVSKNEYEIDFSEINDLQWEKDYLEYLFMQIPYFRLYAQKGDMKIEIFRASVGDEIGREKLRNGILQMLKIV